MPQHDLVAAIGSPSWHRRLRSARSKARKRLKTARRLAIRPRIADLLRLARHHSRPLYREMGKQGWGQQGWQSKWSKGSSSWSSWPPSGQESANASSVWDGYKAVNLSSSSAGMVKKEDSAAEVTQPTTTQMVQRAVNAARRADQKLKKTLEEMDSTQRKWQTYQGQLRELFLKQQDQFNKDLEALEIEAAKNQEAADNAEMKLKAVLDGDANVHRRDATMAPPEEEETDPWEQLIAGPSMPSKQAEEDRRVAKALQRMQAVEKPASVAAGPPMALTPPSRSSGGLPVTPHVGKGLVRTGMPVANRTSAMIPFYMAPQTAQAVQDPYQFPASHVDTAALSMKDGEVRGSAFVTTSPTTRTPIAGRGGKQRTPIKEVNKQPQPRDSGSSEARDAQLQAKREQAMMQAMHHTQVAPQHIAIFDDDDEELSNAGSTSNREAELQKME